MRLRISLVAVLLAVVFAGWKWDDTASAYPSGGDCSNGRYYILLPGPSGDGEYYCSNGYLYLTRKF
jgi:hypothetical protein